MTIVSFEFALFQVVKERWSELDQDFKKKYCTYRAKLFTGSGPVGEGKKKEMILNATIEGKKLFTGAYFKQL